MGALASIKQKHDVAEKVAELSKDAKIVFGGNESFKFNADHPEKGAFFRSNFIAVRTTFTSDTCAYHRSFRSCMYPHAISKH